MKAEDGDLVANVSKVQRRLLHDILLLWHKQPHYFTQPWAGCLPALSCLLEPSPDWEHVHQTGLSGESAAFGANERLVIHHERSRILAAGPDLRRIAIASNRQVYLVEQDRHTEGKTVSDFESIAAATLPIRLPGGLPDAAMQFSMDGKPPRMVVRGLLSRHLRLAPRLQDI